MAAVTTNYGFDVPTSSDLVKNGATQIALLGQDIDTFLFRPFTKNVIINGGFDIWQRGTSFGSLTDGAFFADRWAVDFNGTGATRTVSRQEIAGAWATSSRYFMRYAQSVAGSGGTYNWFHQRIEDVTTLAGQNVVISFWAKADASRSVDVAGSQVFGGGGSSQVNFTLGTAALTTTWTKFSFTVALGSMSGKTIGTNSNVEIDFKLPLNTAMTIDIGDVQLEAGSQATPFSRAGGTLQGELAACQRYYEKTYNVGVAPGTNTGDGLFALYGGSDAFNNYQTTIPMQVAKRNLSYSVATYSESGTASTWNYARSGASSTFGPVIDLKGNRTFRLYGSVGAAYVVVGSSGHWVVDNEL
jgi:hypothetical protein